MQGERRHIRRPAEGARQTAQQGDRGNQGAGDIHGRLSAHDSGRHLCYQRRRARHRLPDRSFTRRILRQEHRQDNALRLRHHGYPVSRRLAGV